MTRDGLIVDLFAGPRPGGWDVGAALAGLEQPIGIEWDEGACSTRAAAGHLTVRADVAAYPPEVFAGADGLIASPPCQEFSLANTKRRGVDSDRGALVHQVMRWATIVRPRWIACEQVPPVLPIWRHFAHELRTLGYDARATVLCAADYGVPQRRYRAILIARRDAPARWPTATHCQTGSMLTRPWVTMADALGWGHGQQTKGARGAGVAERHGDRPPFSWDEPAPTIRANHAKPSEWAGTALQPGTWAATGGNRRMYGLDEPAPTVHIGKDTQGWRWVNTRTLNGVIDATAGPAPSVTGKVSSQWVRERHDERQPPGTITVSHADLGVLQGFPADYPWRGPRIGQQIGNAVPPPLAAAILEALTS